MRKKIAIIGIGGRTGTMLAAELEKTADVLGIGREKEIGIIKKEKFYIEKRGSTPEMFKGSVIEESEFLQNFLPDTIFLTIRNPVNPALKYYYQKIKERGVKPPVLLLSQNGISAGKDAVDSLREIFGEGAKKIQVIRMNIFNPVDGKITEDKITISYSPPIVVSFSKISGSGNIQEISQIFENANFKAKEFPPKKAKNMEFSKLFLNLIGIPSASRELSVKEGYENQEAFKEEIEALKEYIKVVKRSKGNFVNFPKYPVKLLAFLFNRLPINLLLPIRKRVGKIISKDRKGKPKNLGEIDYYTGAVVDLGKKLGIKTPINQRVYKRVLKRVE